MDKILTPTTVEDIDHLAPKLRKADKQECLAYTGQMPLSILHTALLHGDITLTLRTPEGKRIGICGVAPSPFEKAGVIWMCATDAIMKHQMAFLRRSKSALDYLGADYDILHNCVDARNTVHIRWLKWMGFHFIKKHEAYGVEQRPFYEFIRIK